MIQTELETHLFKKDASCLHYVKEFSGSSFLWKLVTTKASDAATVRLSRFKNTFARYLISDFFRISELGMHEQRDLLVKLRMTQNTIYSILVDIAENGSSEEIQPPA